MKYVWQILVFGAKEMLDDAFYRCLGRRVQPVAPRRCQQLRPIRVPFGPGVEVPIDFRATFDSRLAEYLPEQLLGFSKRQIAQVNSFGNVYLGDLALAETEQ